MTRRICYRPSCKKPTPPDEPFSLYCSNFCRKEHRRLVGLEIYKSIEHITHDLVIPPTFKRTR